MILTLIELLLVIESTVRHLLMEGAFTDTEPGWKLIMVEINFCFSLVRPECHIAVCNLALASPDRSLSSSMQTLGKR